MRRTLLLVALALLLGAAQTPAQEDLTQPPRLEDERPGQARLAPRREDGGEALDEIVVVGGGVWRLPDLGSALRSEREAEQLSGRLAVSFLPLYDPEHTAYREDLLSRDTELDRVGFIELFRIDFGGRRAID